jgi:hypothetical protein
VLRGAERLGGSDAQRDVIEETLLFALARSGRHRAAQGLVRRRLDRPIPRPRAAAEVARAG